MTVKVAINGFGRIGRLALRGFRTCLGVLRLFRDLRPSQAEAVSARALEIGAFAYRAVAAIAVRQAAAAARTTTEPAAIIEHSNLRGPGYFH